MKYVRTLLFLVMCIALIVSSCDVAEFDPREELITIMPLGDSRVSGNRPQFESYRYALWSQFVLDGWKVDFIGSQTDEANYPMVSGQVFDTDS